MFYIIFLSSSTTSTTTTTTSVQPPLPPSSAPGIAHNWAKPGWLIDSQRQHHDPTSPPPPMSESSPPPVSTDDTCIGHVISVDDPCCHITTNDTCARHITDDNNPQTPHHRRQHCPSLPQRMWVPHNWHLQNRQVGVSKIRRSQKEGSGRMRRRGGNCGGSKGREEGTGAPPPCSVVPEASKAACNPHAASPELLYPPNNKGFTESTMGQHNTHVLPWFPPFTPSTSPAVSMTTTGRCATYTLPCLFSFSVTLLSLEGSSLLLLINNGQHVCFMPPIQISPSPFLLY